MNWKTYRRFRKGLFLAVISFVFLSVCVRIFKHTNLARSSLRKRIHRDGDPASHLITRSLQNLEPEIGIDHPRGDRNIPSRDRTQDSRQVRDSVIDRIYLPGETDTAKDETKNNVEDTSKTIAQSPIKEAEFAEESTESHEEFMYRMKKRMMQRSSHVKKVCEMIGLKKTNKTYEPWSSQLPTPRPWFFTSRKHRLIYCEIPKSGCTNWKRVMMVLNGLANDTAGIKQGKAHAAKIGWVSTKPNATELKSYRDSLKMMIVREPFERLTSAYWDKVAMKPSINASVFNRFSYEVAEKYGKRGNRPTEEDGLFTLTVCKDDFANLKCEKPHHVIKIRRAMFGRQDDSTCLAGAERNHKINTRRCSSSRSLFVTSQLCDGKNTCEVVASPQVYGVERTCGRIPNYLQVHYTCEDISSANKLTICQGKVETIECPTGSIIRIMSAFYGRSGVNTCSRYKKGGKVNCEAETATAVVKVACDEKTTCIVEASTIWIQSSPCIATDKYLTIWFYCQVLTLNLNGTQEEAVASATVKVEPIAKANTSSPIFISNFTRPIPPRIFKMPKHVYRKYNLHASFDEFVSYLADPENAVVTKDTINHGSSVMRQTSVRHWQNYHTLCYPCHIEYDIIAHLETIEEDSRYVLSLIDAPKNLTYPAGYTTSGHSSTNSSTVSDTFGQLRPHQISKLVELYKTDYRLFQYAYPHYLRGTT